jgi:hypothetical protein
MPPGDAPPGGTARLISESRGRLTASGVAGILKEVERGIKQIETLTNKLEPGK